MNIEKHKATRIMKEIVSYFLDNGLRPNPLASKSYSRICKARGRSKWTNTSMPSWVVTAPAMTTASWARLLTKPRVASKTAS